MSQEKSKTMPMQFFYFILFFFFGGGVKEVYYGICASSEYSCFIFFSLWVVFTLCHRRHVGDLVDAKKKIC